MSELQVGDSVLVVNPDGNLIYSEVLLFLDSDAEQNRLFNTIITESGAKITVTPSHLIFGSENNRTVNISEGYATFAKNIEIGDYVYVRNSADSGKISQERVVDVISSSEKGSFAPLTSEGNILVNNVLASCYALLDDQTLAHYAFMPVRLLTGIENATVHLLQNFHSNVESVRNTILNDRTLANLFSFLPVTFKTNIKHAVLHFLQKFPSVQLRTQSSFVSQKGIHWYPKLLYKVTHHLLPSNLLYS